MFFFHEKFFFAENNTKKGKINDFVLKMKGKIALVCYITRILTRIKGWFPYYSSVIKMLFKFTEIQVLSKKSIYQTKKNPIIW